MKNSLLILIFMLFIYPNSGAQSIENIDQLLGYKEFKFGMKIMKPDTCFKRTQEVFGVVPEEDYTTICSEYNLFLNHRSNIVNLYLDKDVFYKIEFWFKDEHYEQLSEMGELTKVERIWKDLVKLFGEPNKPIEVEDSLFGSVKSYFWEGKKNEIQFLVFKGGVSMSLFIYDKRLNTNSKLSQFK